MATYCPDVFGGLLKIRNDTTIHKYIDICKTFMWDLPNGKCVCFKESNDFFQNMIWPWLVRQRWSSLVYGSVTVKWYFSVMPIPFKSNIFRYWHHIWSNHFVEHFQAWLFETLERSKLKPYFIVNEVREVNHILTSTGQWLYESFIAFANRIHESATDAA